MNESPTQPNINPEENMNRQGASEEFYFTTGPDGLVQRVSKTKEDLDKARREDQQQN